MCKEGEHSFEPRYDRVAPREFNCEVIQPVDPIRVIEAMTTQVYICDVCVRCGAVSQMVSSKRNYNNE
jgi:hypothetical protein